MIKEFKTRTGAIFSDTEHMMEYLYVGDYGKENNIKADFLGLTKEINGVEHHDVDKEIPVRGHTRRYWCGSGAERHLEVRTIMPFTRSGYHREAKNVQ